ncbi:MAG: flavin reductase family protein [Gaiellales bacterium]
MFYRPADGHGLPHSPFNQLVVPRPIGWISSRGADGHVNLAPFSFFNAVSYVPPRVMFALTGPHAAGGQKDSLRNVLETGEFGFNLATWELREQVNLTSAPAPPGTDEIELAGLTKRPARLIDVPLVDESPANFECRLVTTVDLPVPGSDDPNTVVFGEVIGVHIRDDVLVDGLVDVRRLDPIARLGYADLYARVTDIFRMTRPGWPLE